MAPTTLPQPGARARIPRLRPAADLAALRLAPEEYFVISRLDGRLCVDEICLVAGLPEQRTLDILERLQQEGALEMVEAAAGRLGAATASGAAAVARPGATAPLLALPEEGLSRFAARVAPEDPELAEEVDLTAAQKRHLIGLCRTLPELDFYQILDVEPGAGVDDIRRAYYRIAKLIHPDRFFQHRLGSYRQRLATVFRHLQQAYHCLSQPSRRSAYEQTVRAARLRREQEQAAVREAAATAATGGGGSPAASGGASAGSATGLGPSGLGAPDGGPSARLASTGPASAAATSVVAAAGAGRSAEQAATARAWRHYDGCRLLTGGQWMLAAAHLELATTLEPGSVEYRARLQAVRAQMSPPEVEDQLRRAELEAQVGRFEAAVRLYDLALGFRPAAPLYRRAAELLARLGQLAKAREYAMRATMLAPDEVVGHILLASILRETGEPEGARRQLQQALRLQPENAEAGAALARLGPG